MQGVIPAERELSPLARELRKAQVTKGIPAWAVASAAGIARSTLSEIASGRHKTTGETASRIAYALGMSVDELFRSS